MDPKAIKANFDARQNAVAELRALDTEAAGREYTADERAKEERLNAAIAQFDERIAEGLRQLEAENAADEQRVKFAKLTEGRGEGPGARDKDADALRAVLAGEVRGAEFMPTRDEVRALAKNGTNGESNTIHTLYGELHESLRELSTVMEANADVMRTATGEDIVIPRVAGYSVATIVGEAQTIPQSDPSFGPLVTLKAYKYAFLVKVSSELVQDESFDIVGFLARQGGEAFGNGMGIHFLTGTGTGQPQGVVNATLGKRLAAHALTGDELIDTYHSVKSAYRRRAVWVFNDTSVAALRKLKDANGNYIWQSGLVAGAPDTLLGKPVLTDPSMPQLADIDKAAAVFGDLSRAYTVRFASALRVERSDDFAFDSDQTVFRFIQRADGQIIDTQAARTLKTPLT